MALHLFYCILFKSSHKNIHNIVKIICILVRCNLFQCFHLSDSEENIVRFTPPHLSEIIHYFSDFSKKYFLIFHIFEPFISKLVLLNVCDKLQLSHTSLIITSASKLNWNIEL